MEELWPQTASHAINCFSVVIGSRNTFCCFLIRNCFQIKDSCSEFVPVLCASQEINLNRQQSSKVHVLQNPCSLGAGQIFQVKRCSSKLIWLIEMFPTTFPVQSCLGKNISLKMRFWLHGYQGSLTQGFFFLLLWWQGASPIAVIRDSTHSNIGKQIAFLVQTFTWEKNKETNRTKL